MTKKIFVHLKCALVIPAAVTASRQKFEVLKGIIASGICCFAAVTTDLNIFLTKIVEPDAASQHASHIHTHEPRCRDW